MTKLIQSLPATWYHDPDIFRQEQQQIFQQNWNYICPQDQLALPGEFVTSEIGGQSIVLVRSGETQISGFLNLCRHRASPLCRSNQGEIEEFVCPYHSWRYALEGNLVAAPGFEGKIDLQQFSLIPIRVASWNGLVFGCLSDECPDLLDWLGDIVDIAARYPVVNDLEYYSMRENDCPANWKNYSDNSAEGYHLGSIHPGLSAGLVRNRTRIKAYPNGQFVGFDVTYRDSEGNESPGFWIYKFPGLLLHFSESSFNIERVIPVNAVSAKMQRWFWFSPSMGESERNEAVEFSNQVMDEDMGICAAVQKNLEAGIYQTGVLSAEREPGTIFFQQCVRSALESATKVNRT